MKNVKGGVDVVDVVAVGDELVDKKLLVQVVFDEFRHAVDALPATESSSFPRASGDELEWAGRDLLTGSGDSDDARHSPSFVGGFEGLSLENISWSDKSDKRD